MKYSIHSTEAEAQAEIERIEAYLGIPTKGTIRYSEPEEINGKWRFYIREDGPWKCDHVADNLVDVDE